MQIVFEAITVESMGVICWLVVLLLSADLARATTRTMHYSLAATMQTITGDIQTETVAQNKLGCAVQCLERLCVGFGYRDKDGYCALVDGAMVYGAESDAVVAVNVYSLKGNTHSTNRQMKSKLHPNGKILTTAKF